MYMPKYYVSSGRFEKVISRSSPREAAFDALKQDILSGGDSKKYGDFTEVSETGFAYKPNEGFFFITPKLIAGLT